ncbi:MAG: glycoside hydrolase family 3 C-terminal domain-containing protein [Promethearchaeati archaeon]
MVEKNQDNEKKNFMNYLLPFEKRAEDLISQMTLDEKISQIFNISTEIESLNIPYYDWRNEGLQGVAFVEESTIFPQAIAMAATFNEELIENVANVIAEEARARHHHYLNRGEQQRWTGLTFSTPNINIVRDPRWGRGQETFGEDPYLTSRMGVAFCKGLQGYDPKYLKVSAEAKHFVVHSGPENCRHEIDIKVSKKDLYETYLPAFKACVQEGNCEGIMSAYNRVNGEAASASKNLLQNILRDELGFDGYVISDGGAIRDIHKYHKVAEDYAEAAAMALKAGCDILNPMDLQTIAKLKRLRRSVKKALKKNMINKQDIDLTLKRTMRARFKLGMFDPPELVPYQNISYDVINSKKHRELSLHTARESIILLKNENKLLPLNKEIDSIAIIGPNADNKKALYYPHYYPYPPKIVTILEGIQNKVKSKIEVLYAKGTELTEPSDSKAKALQIARKSDLIVGVFGLTGDIEGEEGYVIGPLRGDRDNLKLPKVQEEMIKELNDLGKPFILILTSGSALAIDYAKENIPAIVQAWYAGCEGGNAISEVIFGDYNPAGRLPITFYKSINQLPDYEDYSMIGRTYRYFDEEVIYPFGYGLSYTEFVYNNLEISPNKINEDDTITIKVDIKNIGEYSGEEVVQVYVSREDLGFRVPKHELKAFKRILIERGEIKTIKFSMKSSDLYSVNKEGKFVFPPGEIKFYVGGCQPGFDFSNILSKKIRIIKE